MDAEDLIELLAGAATAMPWAEDEVEARLLRYAETVLPGAGAHIAAEPTPGAHAVAFSESRFLVLDPVARPTHAERRALAALAAMATASAHAARREHRLRQQAQTDDLTGLLTHGTFMDTLERLWPGRDAEEHLGVLYLDLDHFRRVNAELGHLDADAALRGIGARLLALAEHGLTAGRVGGDEFALVARHVTDEEDLERLARQVADTVAEAAEVGGQLLTVTARVGAALSRDPSEPAERVLRLAEQRMRRSKADREATASARRPRHDDAASALADLLDRQAVEVAYQPMVDLEEGRVVAYEALVRARHESLGPLAPLVLVEAASRWRMLDRLTEAVLEPALGTMREVARRSGAPVTLSVNAEFEQLRAGSPLIAGLAGRLGGEVSLVLELSERTVSRWGPDADRAARDLAEAGVGLAVDDFGAGYATFALLTAWRWQWVKIDRQLVSGRDDEAGRRLLGHVAHLLDDLGLPGVAEGIETAEQEQRVRRLGVRYGQGHHLGAPRSAEAVLDDLARVGRRTPG